MNRKVHLNGKPDADNDIRARARIVRLPTVGVDALVDVGAIAFLAGCGMYVALVWRAVIVVAISKSYPEYETGPFSEL